MLAALSLILPGRFVVRPILARAGRARGLKPLVIAGTLLSRPAISAARGSARRRPGAAALCAVAAVGDTVYWTSYHAYFASLGDAEHRGHQLGAREAIAAMVGIVGPLLTGWALTTLGPRIAFGATAAVLALAALPILGTPNVKVAWTAPGAFSAALPGALMFAADGWIAASYVFVWQIALFLSLGESFSAYGGAHGAVPRWSAP